MGEGFIGLGAEGSLGNERLDPAGSGTGEPPLRVQLLTAKSTITKASKVRIGLIPDWKQYLLINFSCTQKNLIIIEKQNELNKKQTL